MMRIDTARGRQELRAARSEGRGLLAAAERAPLSHEGFGLCARLWIAAGLPDHDDFADKLGHIEALHADRIDSEEADARRACRNDTRRLGRIECEGMHHGERVP